MILPVFTGAFYYAYDARPHGLVLGFCGLALVTWQMSLEQPDRKRWLVAFSLALFAAFMTHCFAITLAAPFAMTELLKGAAIRRIEYRRWAALLIPSVLAVIVYIPLLRAYKETMGGTVFSVLAPATWSKIAGFYIFLLTPCILLVVLIVILLALHLALAPSPQLVASSALQFEIMLAIFFLLLPVFGVLLAKFTHGPFVNRYFMSAIAGFSILAGFGIGTGSRAKPWQTQNPIIRWAAPFLAGVLGFSLLGSVSLVLWHRVHGWPERLSDHSSGFSANSSLSGPLANYQIVLSGAQKGERIVVIWPMDFLYLVNYAPQLRSQLYFLAWDNKDPFYRILDRVKPYAKFPYNLMRSSDFLASTSKFVFFGHPSDPWQLNALNRNIILKSVNFSDDAFLAEVDFKAAKP